jgi:hypothetical protein
MMTKGHTLSFFVTLVLVSSFISISAAAQQSTPQLTLASYRVPAAEPVIGEQQSYLPEAPSQHRFWDGKNTFLFASVAALSAADFAVTHANLASGGRELNPIVRPFAGNTALLATNFVAQTAGVVMVSYVFHKTGHHKLERLAPVANVASSAFAVAYGLSHR